jgi:hypothetical protein
LRSDGAGALLKALGQRYVQYFNREYRRSGTLWEGRFRSCLVEQDAYLLLENNRGQTMENNRGQTTENNRGQTTIIVC